jgi:hypothetical protein
MNCPFHVGIYKQVGQGGNIKGFMSTACMKAACTTACMTCRWRSDTIANMQGHCTLVGMEWRVHVGCKSKVFGYLMRNQLKLHW